MQNTFTTPPFGSTGLETSPSFNVVIAYEDLEAGKQAKKTYDFLVHNLANECRCSNQMWKFEVMSIPKLREMAASDAIAADIVIISSGQAGRLSADVKSWLEQWMAAKPNVIALVFLYEKSDDCDIRIDATQAYLAESARQAHLEFFAQPYRSLSKEVMASDPRLPLPPAADISFPAAFTDMAHRELSYPRWGINE